MLTETCRNRSETFPTPPKSMILNRLIYGSCLYDVGKYYFPEWAWPQKRVFPEKSRKIVLGARFGPFGVEWQYFVVNDFGVPKVYTWSEKKV